MSSQWQLLADVIPNDTAEQVHSSDYLERIGSQLPDGSVVVDLGCGIGRSRRMVRQVNPKLKWVGVDIVSSPEVDQRTGSGGPPIVSYDGTSLPFATASVDCIYSNQVLEHVRHPETLLSEVTRVLRPGGSFIGSTSHLEPYHSRSYWNFTPFGFRTIAEDAGLIVQELRPGIDGPTLIERQLRGRPPEMSRFFSQTSPVNGEIVEWGDQSRRRPALVNNRMLQFCGHFAFLAIRPEAPKP